MTFEFRDAKRGDINLLLLLAGGTGSGKTESAMRLATGLSAGQPFAVIDTENGRALHKADDYTFKHTTLDEPYTPERYAEAVADADAAGFRVIVIDSGSHEYEGIGGVLEIQLDEFERMGRKESARMASWIEPKRRHKRFVRQLLRARAHVILCLRSEDKVEIVKQDGKTVVRPKESLIGAKGWIPICEKRLPFEATLSLLLTADRPGVPHPIKLESRHQALVPLDGPLSEDTGRLLAEWAAGGAKEDTTELQARLLELAVERGLEAETRKALEKPRDAGWFRVQIAKAEKSLADAASEGGVEGASGKTAGDSNGTAGQEVGLAAGAASASDEDSTLFNPPTDTSRYGEPTP